jgi:hypothetical protein
MPMAMRRTDLLPIHEALNGSNWPDHRTVAEWLRRTASFRSAAPAAASAAAGRVSSSGRDAEGLPTMSDPRQVERESAKDMEIERLRALYEDRLADLKQERDANASCLRIITDLRTEREELLAVLQEMVAAYGGDSLMVKRARAAIAKAKGSA